MSVSMSKSRARVRLTNSVPHRGSTLREAVERHRLSCCFRSMGSVETLKPCSAPTASEARAISVESVARNTWPRNWWAFISAKASCSGLAEHRRERWPRPGALAPQASPMRMCRPDGSGRTLCDHPPPESRHELSSNEMSAITDALPPSSQTSQQYSLFEIRLWCQEIRC